MSSGSPTPELHGCEREPFPGFNEEQTYLERVNVTEVAEAREAMAAIVDTTAYTPDPQPIHMFWVTDVHVLADHMPVNGAAEVPCWLECPADHPDAVPFWKDAP